MSSTRDSLIRTGVTAAMVLCVAGLTGLFRTPDGGAKTAQHDQSLIETNPVAAMAAAWTGVINFSPAYSALSPYADAGQTDAAADFNPNDDYWGLPRANGYETVAAYCSACHTLQIVMAQRQSREGWDYLLRWMVEKQGMAEPAPETRTEILDYLAQSFSE